MASDNDESHSSKRKRTGESRFNPQWEKDFLFIDTTSGPQCLVCSLVLSHTRKFNIEQHYNLCHAKEFGPIQGTDRDEKLTELKFVAKENKEDVELCDNEVKVSFHIALTLAKNARPFSDGEIIKECLLKASTILCPPETVKFDSVPLSRRTIDRRIVELGEDLEEQSKEHITKFIYFSVALDESTDVTDTAQLAIFVRGVDSDLNVSKELLGLIPMRDTTTAEDIFSCLEEVFESKGLPWEKLILTASLRLMSANKLSPNIEKLAREKVKRK